MEEFEYSLEMLFIDDIDNTFDHSFSEKDNDNEASKL
jgi:hypothetical protein